MAKKSVKKIVHGDGVPSVGKDFERYEDNTLVKYIYVDKPFETIKEVIKEVVVDRIVEKPVEIIKQVVVEKLVPHEVIKEVAVEKVVIKEVPVEVKVEVPVEVVKEVVVEKVVEIDKLIYKVPNWAYGIMALEFLALVVLVLL